MFFPEKVQSIQKNDVVLEIGPGSTPYPRSNVLLDKYFSPEEALLQNGNVQRIKIDKPFIYFDGQHFPFKNKSFDYAVCSHVLEHVYDIEDFVNELQRVAKRGYLEFPTIYYDFIYNIPVHVVFLFYSDGIIYYMHKSENNFYEFPRVNQFFYETLKSGYTSFVNELKPYFFQGIEWNEKIKLVKASSINDLTYDLAHIRIPPYNNPFADHSMRAYLKKGLKKLHFPCFKSNLIKIR